MFVYSIGYKNLIFDFFGAQDFGGPPRPRYIEFDGVTNGKRVVLKMPKIDDPKTFIKNRGEVSPKIDKDDDYRRKEDHFFVERFGRQRWNDENIQYDLAETYYRLGDYESALRKLDEILYVNPDEKTVQYFKEKYTKYKTKLSGPKSRK